MAEEQRPEIDRRKFLKTSSALGAGLVLGATACGSGGDKDAQPTATASGQDAVAPVKKGAPAVSTTGGAGEGKLDGAPAVVPADALVEAVHVALVGCGVQGTVLMESIRKGAPGVLFKAVCDISPYNLKRMKNALTAYKHDVREHAYEDYREMLDREKDLHAVVIATPDWMHAEHSIACMKAGLHVYCEKEMSNDLGKAREMVTTSRQTGKLLQIGHQRRSSERYRFAFEKILREAKLPGTITHAYAQWNRSTAASAPVLPSPRAQPPMALLEKYGYGSLREFACWRWYRKFGGGPICDLGSHQIDIFGWFLEKTPTRVIVDGGRDYWHKNGDGGYEWYDNVRAIYHFPAEQGLVRAQYQVLTTTGAMGYYESFMGTKGTLSLSENPARCRVYAEGHLQPNPQAGDHPWDEWSRKGYVTRFDEPKPKKEDSKPLAGGMADLLTIYKASPPPVQFLMNVLDNATYHGPHLHNFFNAVRGKEKLNCPGEVGYECAVQVLKVNQLLDAGKDSGTFEENEFKV